MDPAATPSPSTPPPSPPPPSPPRSDTAPPPAPPRRSRGRPRKDGSPAQPRKPEAAAPPPDTLKPADVAPIEWCLNGAFEAAELEQLSPVERAALNSWGARFWAYVIPHGLLFVGIAYGVCVLGIVVPRVIRAVRRPRRPAVAKTNGATAAARPAPDAPAPQPEAGPPPPLPEPEVLADDAASL